MVAVVIARVVIAGIMVIAWVVPPVLLPEGLLALHVVLLLLGSHHQSAEDGNDNENCDSLFKILQKLHKTSALRLGGIKVYLDHFRAFLVPNELLV